MFNEQQIVDAIRALPPNQWPEVLAFIHTLGASNPASSESKAARIVTGKDLAKSELIGLWADRTDIADSQAYARQLRHEASHRKGGQNGSGH